MQMILSVNMGPEEYAAKHEEIDFPKIDICPMCKARKRLHSHGSFQRNALPEKNNVLLVRIHRFFCTVCKKTVSLVPSFLVPHFQYTAHFLVGSILGKVETYRELLRFHQKRFLKNLNLIQAFFREMGFRWSLPEAGKERAIKLAEEIENLGVGSFSLLYHKQYHRSFMAV